MRIIKKFMRKRILLCLILFFLISISSSVSSVEVDIYKSTLNSKEDIFIVGAQHVKNQEKLPEPKQAEQAKPTINIEESININEENKQEKLTSKIKKYFSSITLPSFWVFISLVIAALCFIIALPPFIKWYKQYRKRITCEVVKKSLNEFTINRIVKMKSSTKYIPEVFMEIDDLKEKARYFTDPILFWQKATEDVNRLDFHTLNKYNRKFGLPIFNSTLPKNFKKNIKISEISERSKELIKFLESKISELDFYVYKNIKNKIHEDGQFNFQEQGLQYQFITLYQSKFREILNFVNLFNKRVLFITSKAGQGKTNFVCDFTENVLSKKEQLSLFLNAKELSFSREIEKFLYVKLLKNKHGSGFEELMNKIESICKKENKLFIFIIDGLNENSNTIIFSEQLENFVDNLMKFNFIRIIFTCRTEYFEQRFSNFKKANFSEKIIFIDDIHSKMRKVKKGRLVKAYFNFFNIYCEGISKDASDQIANDPLLLRFFCEAYGDHLSKKKINIPKIYDIYKENLFRKYYDGKLKEIEVKTKEPFLRHKFKNILNKIIEYMIKNCRFVDIPISDIFSGNDDLKLLDRILDEDIILRKDLTENGLGSIIDQKSEVVNFTFNEFRDFLLSDYLIFEVFKKSAKKFEGLIDEFIKAKSPVAEGLSKYLFYISKRVSFDKKLEERLGLDSKQLGQLINGKPWYNKIFIECIFSTDDAFITDYDLNKVKEYFMKNVNNSSFVIVTLMNRYNIDYYKNLNIKFLMSIFKALNETEYKNLVNPVYENQDLYYHWGIIELSNDLENVFNKNILERNPHLHNIFELIIFLFDIDNNLKIRELYKNYAKKYPEIAIQQLINNLDVKVKNISINIWKELTCLTEERIEIPDHFCMQTIKNIILAKPNPKTKNNGIEKCKIDFLHAILEKKPNVFLKKEREYIVTNRAFNLKNLIGEFNDL